MASDDRTTIEWFGTSTFRIRTEGLTLFFDGYLDRLPGLATKLMPMTYVIDLARNVFYMGKPEYASVVQYPLGLDVAVTAAVFVTFLVVGTIMFVRADRNR